jgi:uncharacterized protein (TIGR00251 family)
LLVADAIGFFLYIVCNYATKREAIKRKKTMQKRVKVKPNSRITKIAEEEDGSLTVHLKSPPINGKANEELIKALADKYDVPKSRITIKSGLTSRQKLVEIEGGVGSRE